MNSVKKQSRITGILYLSLALIGPFSLIIVPGQIMGESMAQTLSNLQNHGLLFRFGIIGQVAIFLIEIAIIAYLYNLLKKTNRPLILMVTYSRLAMVVLQGGNIVNHLLALESASIAQTHAEVLVHLFLRAHDFITYAWQFFFGFHLIVLGILLTKLKSVPKWITYLVLISSVGYLLDSFFGVLAPNIAVLNNLIEMTLFLSALGEISFTLYLIIKGFKTEDLDQTIPSLTD